MSSEEEKKKRQAKIRRPEYDAKGTDRELDSDAAEQLCEDYNAAPKETRQSLLDAQIPIVFGDETNYYLPDEFKRFKADLSKYAFYQEWTCLGYTCWARRDERFGFWLGYMNVPPGHKLYGLDLQEDTSIKVHQGVTMADKATYFKKDIQKLWGDDKKRLDDWVFGFDTNHDIDWNPRCNPHKRERSAERNSVYRDFPFVQSEIEKLVKQLDALEPSAAAVVAADPDDED